MHVFPLSFLLQLEMSKAGYCRDFGVVGLGHVGKGMVFVLVLGWYHAWTSRPTVLKRKEIIS